MTQGQQKNWPTSYATFKLALSRFGKQIWPASLLMLVQLTWFFFVSSALLVTSALNEEAELVFNSGVSLIIIGMTLAYFVIMSIVSTRLAQHDEPSGFVKLFDHKTWRLLLPAALLMMGYTLSVVVGSFLLVIPGILAFLFFSMTPFILIWEEMGVVDSFRQSFEYVKGLGWHLLMRVNFFLFFLAITRVFAIIPGSGQTVSFVLSLFVGVFAPFYMGEVYRQVVLAQKNKLENQVTTGTKALALIYGVLALLLLMAVVGLADFVSAIYPYPFAVLSVF